MRGNLTRSSDDRFNNAFGIAHHIVVPEPQNEIAKILQLGGSSCIVSTAFAVLPTI